MFTAAVLTVSDSAFKKLREDLSGPTVKRILEENGFEVKDITVVPDETDFIVTALERFCADGVNLIATTGGTGFSPRDVTPEATVKVAERLVPGVAEAMRANSMRYTDKAMLSRAVCGIKKGTVILNLPGSPKACEENLNFVINPLKHGIEVLLGQVGECARK